MCFTAPYAQDRLCDAPRSCAAGIHGAVHAESVSCPVSCLDGPTARSAPASCFGDAISSRRLTYLYLFEAMDQTSPPHTPRRGPEYSGVLCAWRLVVRDVRCLWTNPYGMPMEMRMRRGIYAQT